MSDGITILSVLASISAGTWVDIGCLLVVLGMICLDASRGFSNTLATLLGLLIACHAGYWLYPSIHTLAGYSSIAEKHYFLGMVLPYILAVLAGLVLFIIMRLCFRKFFRLLVEQPADKVLGAISGFAKGLLILLLVFSCISLFPENTPVHRVFCNESITGRAAIPVLQNVLSQTYPNPKISNLKNSINHGRNTRKTKNKDTDSK